jgi:hypothetical protein
VKGQTTADTKEAERGSDQSAEFESEGRGSKLCGFYTWVVPKRWGKALQIDICGRNKFKDK